MAATRGGGGGESFHTQRWALGRKTRIKIKIPHCPIGNPGETPLSKGGKEGKTREGLLLLQTPAQQTPCFVVFSPSRQKSSRIKKENARKKTKERGEKEGKREGFRFCVTSFTRV